VLAEGWRHPRNYGSRRESKELARLMLEDHQRVYGHLGGAEPRIVTRRVVTGPWTEEPTDA